MIVKELENKSVLWFENSNQYLVLEPIVAHIIEQIQNQITVKTIADNLSKKMELPIEKATDFVLDIQQKIVLPNQEATEEAISEQLEYTTPDCYEFTKYYSINTKVFKVQFSNEFELSLIHPKFAHLETQDKTVTDFSFEVFTNGTFTFLIGDNSLIGSWSRENIHYFQGKFSMKIIECIYQKEEKEWMGVFHASALSSGEQSILILGDSGNGKSTSLALLQANGFTCVADDFVPIDNGKDVHSFPAGISIKKNSLKALLSIYPELKDSAEYHYKRLGKIVRYLPPKTIDYSKRYPCTAFIFIKYNADVEFEFQQISNIKAFEHLIPDSWISKEPENVTVFLDWFSSLPCYQLTYSNNEKMIQKVRELFENDI